MGGAASYRQQRRRGPDLTIDIKKDTTPESQQIPSGDERVELISSTTQNIEGFLRAVKTLLDNSGI